ncbi:MAG: dockerin type I domain-containing protein [Planctomycetota bacterium]|nr:dockerin type I domain-containing protein [Planctomycetota bacterium]
MNDAPVLAPIGNKSVDAWATLTFTATATDVDQPADTLTYNLDAASLGFGMTINGATGEFSWMPTVAQRPGSYDVTLTVTDNGSPARSDSKLFTIAAVGPTWRSPFHPCDITGDGHITPLDVLTLINEINANHSRVLATASPPASAPPPFLDPDDDGSLTPTDVLIVINYIHTSGGGQVSNVFGGEGEAVQTFDMHPQLPIRGRDAAEDLLSTHQVPSEWDQLGFTEDARQIVGPDSITSINRHDRGERHPVAEIATLRPR